jgi:uncharacterized protein GlcG (DUF336 family)
MKHILLAWTFLIGVFASHSSLAQAVTTERTITLTLANEMAAAAVEACAADKYSVVAAIVDRSGHVKAVQRADNARPHAIDIAQRKATTSAMLGYETSKLAENIQKGITPASILNTPGFTSLLGGFPIKIGNEVIGGIGVSGAPGGQFDAACVEAAFKRVGDKLK